ncbi:MAG: patatin-like phospholipase family protein [Bacteroidota bacterium]
MKKIGLVLSGGGVRGIAHIGILQALEEEGIQPTLLSGSSAGAMVAALYAADYPPKEMLDFFRQNNSILRWRHFSYSKPGLLDAEGYASMFDHWLKDRSFDSLSKELHICATDVLSGLPYYFSKGDLVKAILASSAVPGIFTPVEISSNWYVDGGTMNNFPTEPIADQCDLMIGSFVSPEGTISKKELTNSFKMLNRAIGLSVMANSLLKFHVCDFVFMPKELAHYGLFDTSKMDEIYEIGYQYAQDQLDNLWKAIGGEIQRQLG